MASRSGPFATTGQCVHFVQDADIATAVTLESYLSSVDFVTKPRPDIAIISVEGDADQGIRYRTDGTDPTSSVGHLVEEGTTVQLGTPLALTKIIETDTSVTINISFYAT